MTKDEADGVLSRYYPDYLSDEDLDEKYMQTPEYKNLAEKCEEAKSMLTTWGSIVDKIREELPETFGVLDYTHLFRVRPCLRVSVTYPALPAAPNRVRGLMLNVSILIDYFSIYISEMDRDSSTWGYTLPVIGFKNTFDSDYVIRTPLKGSMHERIMERGLFPTTREFIYEERELDKIVFNAIDAAMSEYLPAYKKIDSPFLFESSGNFTNGERLKGETTYFDCLFTDHIF